MGAVDQFTVENFNKFADKNLYIFNPGMQTIDQEKIKEHLERSRELWAKAFHKPNPETEIMFISNPESKAKKL